uniref:Protein kinase domain-containing protein n=1 Tax=Oryza glumipatula TaxID=40148 RepID=A0A0D9ZJK7_9ORYZ
MASYSELTILRLTIAFAAAALLAGGAEVLCRHSCGGIDIPYPFGIGSGDDCALFPGYKIDCNNNRPFYLDVEVLSISLQLGQMRVMTPISSSCYNTTSRKMDSTMWSFNLSDTPFMLSDSNKFTVVGCRSLAYISDPMSNYTSGCASSCPGATVVSATNGTCSGIGCCQTTIPRGLEYYEVLFGESLNTSEIYNDTPCSYAVLMDYSNFTFSNSYLATPLEFNSTYGGQAPVMFDWAIWDARDCVEAKKNLTSYACKSDHSVCINYSSGTELAYMCNCSEGYHGNPYIKGSDGCQDIDECEHPESYSCYGECRNKDGGFDCFCHAGTRGNASIPGGCQKNFLTPKARLAIGAVACILSILFGFLGWEVIRHKRSIKRQALLRQNDEFFQQHGGQLLLEMMKVEGNAGFTLYDRQEIETATNNFNKAYIIGEGGQGTVYRAVLGGFAVAIKMCKEIDESRKMEFVQELVILCRVNHPNIVKLLGCCLQFEAPMLVYEFVQNKTLQELLDVQRSRRFHVTLGTRLRIAAESAGALAHLHSLSHPILHGDVKPANILLAEGLVAKVSDFGCSTIDENTQAVPKGTPGYIDPDYLLEYQLTAKNDVYSFGVILLELLTGKKPLSKERKSLTSMFQEAMVNDTLCELLDSDIVDEASMKVIYQVAVLASQCLVVPGTTRPVMALVAEELRRLALADEVLRYPQPPLVLEGLSFLNMGSTVSIWYDESKTSGVYSLENNVVLSTEFAR